MKKKLIVVALFILLMLAAIPTAMACNHPSSSQKWIVVRSATCGSAGLKVYKCVACSTNLANMSIPATGNHTYKWSVTKAATCTTSGTKQYKCSGCGRVNATETISPKGHNYTMTSRTDATCTKPGVANLKCMSCSKTTTEQTSAALGHSWSSWRQKTAPTCVKDGTEEHWCLRSGCSARGTRAKSKTGIHDWSHKVYVCKKDPTYYEPGYIRYKCPDCPETKDESISKLAYGSVQTDFCNDIVDGYGISKNDAKLYTDLIASWTLIIGQNLDGYDQVKSEGDLNKYVKNYKPGNMTNKEYEELINELARSYTGALFDAGNYGNEVDTGYGGVGNSWDQTHR